MPRESWPANFRAAGYSDSAIAAFCEVFDGFNNGRGTFEGTHQTRHGVVNQAEVFQSLQNTGRALRASTKDNVSSEMYVHGSRDAA